MQGLPSAILGDQRELARLPEASVSNPIQAFSLSKGLSSLAASFPVYSRMRTGARRLSYRLVRFSGFSISSRKTIWNGKAAHSFMPAASPKALTANSHIFSTPPTRPQPGETPPTHFGLEKAPAVGYRMGLSISKSFFRALHDPYSIGRGRLTRRSDSLAPIRLIRHGGQDRNPLDTGHECCVWSLTIFHRFCSFNAPSNKSFQRSAG